MSGPEAGCANVEDQSHSNPRIQAPVSDLVHDWGKAQSDNRLVGLVDETIRDGLQSPRAPNLGFEKRLEILDQISRIGISDVIVGMVSEQNYALVKGLLKHIRDNRHRYVPWILIRAKESDLDLVLRLRDELGMPIGLNTFIGASRIRMTVEGWCLTDVCHRVEKLVQNGVAAGFAHIRVAVEDATRAFPEDLRDIVLASSGVGATRLCLADTFGGVWPEGVTDLVRHTVGHIASASTLLEWHGHNDQGLALANSITALSAGAQYVHGTICGVGERNGNASLEALAVLAHMRYGCDFDWAEFTRYVGLGQELFAGAIASAAPFFGESTFESATGTHIAAIGKALAADRPDIAHILFSPPSPINDLREPIALIGSNTGRRGVELVLNRLNLSASEDGKIRLMQKAAVSERVLSVEEIKAFCDPVAQ